MNAVTILPDSNKIELVRKRCCLTQGSLSRIFYVELVIGSILRFIMKSVQRTLGCFIFLSERPPVIFNFAKRIKFNSVGTLNCHAWTNSRKM